MPSNKDKQAEGITWISPQSLIQLRLYANQIPLDSGKIHAKQGGAYVSAFKGRGMEFDEISGKYRIEGGVLHTRDTRMYGPAAKIKISGKTGIVDRDYDQRIRVIPNIRHTLPILGVVAVGTTVGWGLLLLQNVFKKAIDDAVEIEYRVSGSWDDPQVELIKAVDENQQDLPNLER